VRRFARTLPGFILERAGSDYPMIHLFDGPQFNIQDGYIGFMLDFFRKLRREERPVFVCLHPNQRYHVEILREVCGRYMFVCDGRVSAAPDSPSLLTGPRVRHYLGHLI
jgi:ABC-type histidine transport system ATPase subunit